MTRTRSDRRDVPRFSPLAGLVILVCALGLVSCAPAAEEPAGDDKSTGDRADKSGWPAAEVERGLVKGLALPIEPYLQTYPEEVALQHAKNVLNRACMKRFGFDYDPPAPGNRPPHSYNAANMKRRWGITDPAEAREHGYRLPREPTGDWKPYELQGPDANYVFDLTTASGQKPPAGGVYEGDRIPEGGCRGETDRKLGSYDDSLAAKINVETFQRAKQDPGVLAVNHKWSSCMKGKGYRVGTPLEALNQAFSNGTAKASQAEIAMAIADIDCKKSTHLIDVYFSTETTLQKKRIEEEQLALDEQKSKNETIMKRAAEYR